MTPAPNSKPKPRIGISACLLGQKVRHDGGHKRDFFLTETLGHFVEWAPVCPELEVGMGVPRETVRLMGGPSRPRMIAESGKDWTRAMEEFAKRRVSALSRMGLSGYIFKKNSPSCGMERVKLYGKNNAALRRGRGLFARAVISGLPLLPVEEEGRLNDPRLRENFITRVFAYHRWRKLAKGRVSVGRLVEFHTRHKFSLLAHSEKHYRRLGRIVAEAKKRPPAKVMEEYGELFMAALAERATAKKNANVLEHMLGFFSQELAPDERAEVLEVIRDYRLGRVPLIVPLTLIRHFVRKYQVAYLMGQTYLDIDPRELMLLNHV